MKNLEINNADNLGKRTIGLEFENPLLKTDGDSIDFKTIQAVWRSFEKHGWIPRHDPVVPNVIDAVSKEFEGVTASIISDSGAGNFELALSPQESIHSAKSAFELVYAEAKKIVGEHELILTGLAIQPGHIESMEGFRRRNAMYAVWDGMDSSDMYSNVTSSAISAHQVGVGMKPSEFVDVTNEITKISGLIVALSGNSPIGDWKILPYKEWRIISIGIIRFVSNFPWYEKVVGFPERPFTSIADFFKYYWNSPAMMLPLLKDGWVIPDEKMNFLDYFRSKGISGHTYEGKKVVAVPEPSDINWASIQMWPYVKPHIALDVSKVTMEDFMKNLDDDTLENYFEGRLTNCYVECRAGGAAPVGEEMTLPALMLGLVDNISELKKLTAKHSWNEWKTLILDASIKGINANINGKSIVPLLTELHEVARTALVRRGLGEEKYLDVIKKRIETRKNPADLAIEAFKKGKSALIDFIRYK